MNTSQPVVDTITKGGTVVAVAASPVTFVNENAPLISLCIGFAGLLVAAFSSWVNYKRYLLSEQKETAHDD